MNITTDKFSKTAKNFDFSKKDAKIVLPSQTAYSSASKAKAAHSEERKTPGSSSKIIGEINVPKGVGIQEQNIYQIICPSSNTMKQNSPYLVEIYKNKLEEKKNEVT